MKLLIITAVKVFEKEIGAILKDSAVLAYSHQDVIGHGNSPDEMASNWFASSAQDKESVMFHVFAKEDNVDKVFEGVKAFNQKQESQSRIHVAVLNIEKSNEDDQ